jgi:hypothetical protein
VEGLIMETEIYRTAPKSLSDLLGANVRNAPQWRPDELGDILRHQLEAPLLFDLRGSGIWQRASMTAAPAAACPHSFGELLRHPSPPIDLLRLTKDFAKSSDLDPESPLPTEVATTLYYAAIVVAHLRHGQLITELEPGVVERGVEWALRRPWLDEITRELFEEWWSARVHASKPARH